MAAHSTLPLFSFEPEPNAAAAVPKPRVARALPRPPGPGEAPQAGVRQSWLAIHLLQLPRDSVEARGLLERIACWCHQFSPLVSLEPPDELLLEVQGSLRLFGGAQQLVGLLDAGLKQRKIAVRLALAPTARSALWLARSDGMRSVASAGELARQLASLPLRCLRWPDETMELLLRLGLRSVGDLLRLPRAGLARRLGPFGPEQIEQALGRRPEPRRGFRAAERYDERFALEMEIETTGMLERLLEPLLAGLRRFLLKRQAAIASLGLELTHRSHPVTRLRIGLAAASGDVAHLHVLLRERLRSLSLPAPVYALRLRSGMVLASAAMAESLWQLQTLPQIAPPVAADALPRLVERLRARWGSAAVFAVRPVADHRPERAWRVADLQPRHSDLSIAADRAARPLWLLAAPSVLAEKAQLPARLRIESGPERIETGWWDGQEVTRDYYIARDAHGARLWIYRSRRPPHGWYLHGLFG